MNNKKAQNLDIQTNRTNNNQKAVFLQSKINKKYTPQMTSQEDMIKDQKILSTLIDFNSSYFQEKVKINQTRKPSKYRFKIPTRTGNSEYSKEYYKSIDSYNIQGAYPERKRIKSLIRLPNFYITRDSSYRKDYPQPIVKNPEQKYQTNLKTIKKRMLSLDEPFFADTSTYKQYAIKQIDDNVGMNKMSTLMLYGGKFKEATIYSKAYINKQQRPAELILPKNHSIFTQRKSHNVSNYKESYVDPSEQGTSSHLKTQEKLKTKSIPILANKRLKTQYENSYVEQLSTEKRQFQCLSQMQLKTFLLSNLSKT